jgi:hypothetical protein
MSTSLTTRRLAIGAFPPLPSLPRGYNGSLVHLMMYVYIVNLAPNYVPQVTLMTSGIKI